VGDILEIIKVNLPSKITIHWEPPDDEIWLYMNPVQFKQVVMNLSLNAIQAMEELNEKGELTIALAKDQFNRIILEISDTGPGQEGAWPVRVPGWMPAMKKAGRISPAPAFWSSTTNGVGKVVYVGPQIRGILL